MVKIFCLFLICTSQVKSISSIFITFWRWPCYKGERGTNKYTHSKRGQFFPVPHIIKNIIHFLFCSTINFSQVIFNLMTLKGFSHNRKRGGGIQGLSSCEWKDTPILSQSSESELIFLLSELAKNPWLFKDAQK